MMLQLRNIRTLLLYATVIAVAATSISVPDAIAAVRIARKHDSYVKRTITVRGTKYEISLVAINLANPELKVLTYTGTNKDNCYNKSCNVKALKKYVDEGKGFAAIHGAYACPADYAQCAGQEGAYYWMVFNHRNGKLVNLDQNRFNRGGLLTIDANRNWHFFRDTRMFPGLETLEAVDGAPLTAGISNGPALVDGGKNVLDVTLLDHKQRYVKSSRGGIGIRGSTMYLVIARNATVIDLGRIMRELKFDVGLNLDGGGSSALWYRGQYRVGPGRNLAHAVVFSEE